MSVCSLRNGNMLFGLLILTLLGLCELTLGERRTCKDNQYYDPEMSKCHLCAPLCQGQTLHTECPQYCPDMYAAIQAKEGKPEADSHKNTLDKTLADKDEKAAEETPDGEDQSDGQSDGKTGNGSTGNGESGQLGMLVTAIMFSSLIAIIAISVLGVLYMKRRSRPGGDAEQPTGGETAQRVRNPGAFQSTNDQEMHSGIPLLPQDQSNQSASLDQGDTQPKTLLPHPGERPPPMGHGADGELTLPTFQPTSSSLAGHVITHPHDDDNTKHPQLADLRSLRGYPMQTEV